MPSLAFALRNLLRDLKSGELAVLVLALLVAVASLTAVGFFTSRIGLAVERQAGEVLAADLRLESARPIADAYDAEAARRGLRSARIESMPSVVFFGQESSLIALRAVGAGYPLRGRLKTADKPFGAGRGHRRHSRAGRSVGRFAVAREARRAGGFEPRRSARTRSASRGCSTIAPTRAAASPISRRR